MFIGLILKIGLYDETYWSEDKDFRLRFEEFHAIDHLAIPTDEGTKQI